MHFMEKWKPHLFSVQLIFFYLYFYVSIMFVLILHVHKHDPQICSLC